MKTNSSLMIAVIEQAGVPALRVAFTIAVIIFLFGGIFIFRVWGGLMLVLLSILYQVWRA